MTWTPPPGTIGLTFSYGFTAFRATLGQALTNETTTYSHAFVVVSKTDIVEPWPCGARVSDIDEYAEEHVAYGFLPDLSRKHRQAVATAALSLDGVPHGMVDYLALAAHRYGWKGRRLRRRMANPGRLLPAQFVLETYRRAGVELMPGFDPGDVTMEDLGSMLLTSTDWELRSPCMTSKSRGRYAG